MTYPEGLPIDTQHSYLRDRTPQRVGTPTTQIAFAGTRTSLSSSTRYEMGAGGGMVDATELIWIDLSSYGGFVDVATNDIITELDTGLLFSVISAENPSAGYLKITAKSARRGGPN